jgi:Amt family ammonium transporter
VFVLGFGAEGIGGVSVAAAAVAAGVVQGWAAMIMGIAAGSIPWYTMMIFHKRSWVLQQVDDTLGVFHTHAVAGFLGGVLTGLFAEPTLANYFVARSDEHGAFYGGHMGGRQLGKQLVGALFIIGWNLAVTSIILNVIRLVIPLRMSEEHLIITKHGSSEYDDTQHGLGNNGLNVGHARPPAPAAPAAAPPVDL